jgi:hypothetical protein
MKGVGSGILDLHSAAGGYRGSGARSRLKNGSRECPTLAANPCHARSFCRPTPPIFPILVPSL